MCRVRLSLRGNGSKTTHSPFHLPIPHIRCQTPRMNRLLILPVLLLILLVGTPASSTDFQTLLVGTPAFSADFQKGLTAYDSEDYATALREWTPLAKQGDAPAQYNLGLMYQKGLGVPQDYKTAVKWYRLSADQGYADAQNNLGVMYRDGKGVPQDDKTAVKWYRLSAEQGNSYAQGTLEAMYAFGTGL